MSFYEAWWYLLEHPIFKGNFNLCLDIDVVKVNPETLAIDDDKDKNTLIQVWLECGEYCKECLVHDVDLDCGGNSFEEAIVELARLVKRKYG